MSTELVDSGLVISGVNFRELVKQPIIDMSKVDMREPKTVMVNGEEFSVPVVRGSPLGEDEANRTARRQFLEVNPMGVGMTVLGVPAGASVDKEVWEHGGFLVVLEAVLNGKVAQKRIAQKRMAGQHPGHTLAKALKESERVIRYLADRTVVEGRKPKE